MSRRGRLEKSALAIWRRSRLYRHRIRHFLELRDLVEVHVAIDVGGLGAYGFYLVNVLGPISAVIMANSAELRKRGLLPSI